jgi:hypothetical protein
MTGIPDLSHDFTTTLGVGVTNGHATVPPLSILFYVAYLTVMWFLNGLMFRALRRLPADQRRAPRRFAVANTLLAGGDTAMFICFFLLAVLKIPMGLPAPPGRVALEVAGVLTTSLTMSCYYLFLSFYLHDRFPARSDRILMVLIIALFAIRIALHYYPQNVWISMVLPPGTPNFSAWIRNAPLLIYGLGAVLLILWRASKSLAVTEAAIRRRRLIMAAMAALIVSFAFYLVDVFFAHAVPNRFIWIGYTLKTVAYVLAARFMYLGEFNAGAACVAPHPVHTLSAE